MPSAKTDFNPNWNLITVFQNWWSRVGNHTADVCNNPSEWTQNGIKEDKRWENCWPFPAYFVQSIVLAEQAACSGILFPLQDAGPAGNCDIVVLHTAAALDMHVHAPAQRQNHERIFYRINLKVDPSSSWCNPLYPRVRPKTAPQPQQQNAYQSVHCHYLQVQGRLSFLAIQSWELGCWYLYGSPGEGLLPGRMSNGKREGRMCHFLGWYAVNTEIRDKHSRKLLCRTRSPLQYATCYFLWFSLRETQRTDIFVQKQTMTNPNK